MKKLNYFFCCLLAAFPFLLQLSAQDKLPIKFGKVTAQDFDITSPVIDSSTNAVVVANVGKSEFFANASDRTLSLLYKEKKRIKIINRNGYDAATVSIHLYVDDNNKAETLQDIDAVTYNLEDGKVVRTKLERSSIFTEKISKNWIVKKFTFPALKEGSLVEYSYEVKSDFYFNFQPWVFQGEYPVLWSQYEASIPEFFKYVILAQGYQQFFINKTESTGTSFSFSERTTANTSIFTSRGRTEVNNFTISGLVDYHTWVMKNVPALKVEPFTSTLRNSIDKIEFQLKEIAFPNSYPRTIMNSWQKVSEDLLLNENFGAQINRANNWLDDDVKNIIGGITKPVEKVKRIYEYVRDNFVCNDSSGRYITTSLKDAFRNRAGSVADINMLLIAMLRTQDIDAYPVILGTRDNGATNEYYPIMERYNYVIARVDAGNETFYLDAATPRLAFNKLPLKAYNGHARVMNKAADPVFFVADSINEAASTIAFVSNGTNGVEGYLVNNKGYYQALSLRNKIAKTGTEEYKKDIQKEYSEDVLLSNFTIDSLKKLDEPVAVKYDLTFKAFGDADIVYFDPMLGEAIKKNPFTAAQRFYPVEMPYTVDETYTFNMEMPKGYQVDELPKSARIMLNENEGMFEYLVSANADAVQMRCRLQLKRATYLNEDYESLRDFFAYVVKKEAEQIVFKKVK